MRVICSLLVWICVICCHRHAVATAYKIGVGRADCTGPPVEIVFVSKINANYIFSTLKYGGNEHADWTRISLVLEILIPANIYSYGQDNVDQGLQFSRVSIIAVFYLNLIAPLFVKQ